MEGLSVQLLSKINGVKGQVFKIRGCFESDGMFAIGKEGVALKMLHKDMRLALLLATALVGAPTMAQDAPAGTSLTPAGSEAGPVGEVEPLGGPLPVLDDAGEDVQGGPIELTPIEETETVPDDAVESSVMDSDDFAFGAAGRDEGLQQILGDDAGDPFGFGVVAALGLSVNASLTTKYSDNLRRARVLEDGASRSDWMFRPQLGVSGGHRLGRHMLFFDSSIARDYHARFTNLDSSRFRAGGGLQWVLGSRCGGRFQADYSTRSTEYDDFEDVVSARRNRTSLMAAATCRMATGLRASMSYGYMTARNKPAYRSFADVNTHSIGGSLGYAIGRRGEVGARFGWIDATNPNQDFGPFGIGGTKVRSIGGYGKYRLSPSIAVDGGIGHAKAKPKTLIGQGFSGITWDAGVRYGGPRISLRANAGRTISSGRGGQSNLKVGRHYGLSGSYTASDHLNFSAGYLHSKSGHRGTGIIVDPSGVREQTMDRWHAGASYRLNRMLSTSLNYRHQKRTANLSMYDYSANTVALTIRAGF